MWEEIAIIYDILVYNSLMKNTDLNNHLKKVAQISGCVVMECQR